MPDAIVLTKFFAVDKAEVDAEARTLVHRITTEAVDREREVVKASGIRLDDYRANPIVLWAHRMDELPIGKNLWVKQDSRGLIAKTQFAKTPRADEIWTLYRDGFLKGFSIGFLPDHATMGAPRDAELKSNPDWRGARNVVRDSSLLEYSACPIPVNPEALARAWVSKAVTLSTDVVKDLGLETPEAVNRDTPPERIIRQPYTVYDDVKAGLTEELESLDMEAVAARIAEEIPRRVAEAFRVARGGV